MSDTPDDEPAQGETDFISRHEAQANMFYYAGPNPERQSTCGICLEEMERDQEVIRHVICGNDWHPDCVNEWFLRLDNANRDVTCPKCREVIVTWMEFFHEILTEERERYMEGLRDEVLPVLTPLTGAAVRNLLLRETNRFIRMLVETQPDPQEAIEELTTLTSELKAQVGYYFLKIHTAYLGYNGIPGVGDQYVILMDPPDGQTPVTEADNHEGDEDSNDLDSVRIALTIQRDALMVDEPQDTCRHLNEHIVKEVDKFFRAGAAWDMLDIADEEHSRQAAIESFRGLKAIRMHEVTDFLTERIPHFTESFRFRHPLWRSLARSQQAAAKQAAAKQAAQNGNSVPDTNGLEPESFEGLTI